MLPLEPKIGSLAILQGVYHMLRAIFVFVILVTQMHAALFDWLNPVSPKVKRLQQLVEGFEPTIEKALADYQVPGIAIGIVSEGQLIYAKGFGHRDIESKLPVTPNTVFAIGSCSKAFTSFLAGMFVDEGLFSWDARVIDLIPEFRLWDAHATMNVTMRDLLTHRTGLPRHDFMWYGLSSIERSDIVRRLRYLEPSSDIREHYQYNNLMYLAAGYAMERLASKSWETLATERILNPLEMVHTSFSIRAMQQAPDFATPHTEKEGTLKKMAFRDISLIAPAGGISSNISDLANWVQMHLSGGMFHGKSLISPASLQEMHTPQAIISGTPESKESHVLAIGIGWRIMSYRGHYYLSHDGGIDGFTSIIGLLPRDDLGIIILSNRNLTGLPRCLAHQLLDRLLELPSIDWLQDGLDGINKGKDALKEKLLRADLHRVKGTHPSHPLEVFTGDYLNPGYGTLSIALHDGRLQASMNGLVCNLSHWHYNTFAIQEELQDMLISREGTKLLFQQGINGDIEKVSAPFEPNSSDIVFVKRAAESLSATEYLRQFTGIYEIYGYVVEIVLRGGVLCAVIPGEPLYELVPISKGEFAVKSLIGYTVRFITDPLGQIEEVLLVQPYGAFSAKPKKRP
ncbi:MAG: serine hydrolase [Chlamydiia bacterium]|nr:serine hydrolase [Chlamydiia bacterium]